MRILSGMQPSGKPHLGNYLGAMNQHIEMQNQYDCYYFIANYHALTTVKDGKKLVDMTFELALDYLALGLNPEKSIFFKQSDVPSLTELCWIFNCLTNMGMAERCHAWKDAMAKQKKEISIGLFDYPILMAADILIYQPDIVPVGQDQKQHVEVAKDIAQKFNHIYGETFKLPESKIKKEVAVVPGTDGQKMSKSYGNTIEIFAEEKDLKKQVMNIVTDSKELHESKNPETCNVFQIYKLMANKNETENLKDKYINGGFGYGDAKKLLFESILNHFKHAREKRIELKNNLLYVEEVLEEGAKKARKTADKTMAIVREKTGL